MDASEILTDGFERVRDGVHQLLEQVSAHQLDEPPATGANPVGWLVWHLIRVQDQQVAEVVGEEPVWTSQGWHQRSGLPLEPSDIGYGHSPQDVAAVRLDAGFLQGYLDAVHEMTASTVAGLTDHDLDRVVDDTTDPPVTAGVRLVSVLGDDLQHLGQAGYVLGLLTRA